MVRNASQKDKEKWAKQLEMTVKGLVEEDIVWKNASPENIFIDDNGHIVVDWLRLRRDPGRWVSEKNQDTMAGNTESLVKIIRFIDPSLLPEVDPRPRAGELSSHSN
ncbi:hypothetical protein QBC46DRAFT_394874 [Diplogelasinospora grovesii]|uniref:Uncharacterized protein n=1 Tax=Diplogelasinospora grovesii TaxID=303347 RepID=A0AAN6MZQ4_9PEZI|nr:hypothetical protein QBC46DRAFT_394874 [Diplogelasinospora grovesii]